MAESLQKSQFPSERCRLLDMAGENVTLDEENPDDMFCHNIIGGGGSLGKGRKPRGQVRQRCDPPGDSLPLEEAAKLELLSKPVKTPVSVLQELLIRRGTTPKYELVQVEGAIHEPTFRYRVTVGEALAMGTGRSKKEAKHAAAKAVLDKLAGNGDGNVVTSTVTASTSDDMNMDIRMAGNPIGLLQELCMSRRWPPPTYETEYEEGLPHERQFTIACIVFRFKEVGVGKSKKVAKRMAAFKMYSRLKDLPCENNTAQYGLDDDDEIAQRMASDLGELKSAKVPTLTTQHTVKISQFHKQLKSSEGPKLLELQVATLMESNFNFVEFLQEIAAEQNFEVTYVDIEEKSISGKSQCLVQLSTLPVAVCYGVGTSSEEAQSSAALHALQYLKIMTK